MKLSQRGMFIWLGMIGIALAAVLLSGGLPSPLPFVFLAAYLVIAFLAVTNQRPTDLRKMMSPITSAVKVKPAARKATQRARARSNYASEDHILTDIGIIVNEKLSNGDYERLIKPSINLDDGAVQPYVTLEVASGHGERLVLVDYEIVDQAGHTQFSHKIEQWVRDGNNLILCDRQLKVRDNESLGRAGIWDLKVKIDGQLAAVHAFNVAPAGSRQRLAVDDDDRGDTEDEDQPLSLEDLLREQQEQNQRRSTRS